MDKVHKFMNEKKARNLQKKLEAYGKIVWLETKRIYDRKSETYQTMYLVVEQ